jgi:hypothetical protein
VIEQEAGREVPVLCRLRVANRLYREAVLREPACGRAMQPGQLVLLRGVQQLELQQVSKQVRIRVPGQRQRRKP